MPGTDDATTGDRVVKLEPGGPEPTAPEQRLVQEFADRVERIEEDLAALKAELSEIAAELGGSSRQSGAA